jgi:lactate permease
MWFQNYDPFHFWPLSTLLAALPIITLFVVLVYFKKSVWISALCGLMVAALLSWIVFKMPQSLMLLSAGYGFTFGFMEIAWIIVGTIFTYNIAVETGLFKIMKESIASVSADERVQVILIAFCFGAFLEGACGGGAPVAIAGSFLIGMGFRPMQAAFVCLLANTAPVAWGAVGAPVRILTAVTGIENYYFSAAIGRILPIFSFFLPVLILLITTSRKKTWEVLPVLLFAGATFGGMQFLWSNFVETGLVDIVSGIFSLIMVVIFLRFWQPKNIIVSTGEKDIQIVRHDWLTILRGWSPFILISLCIFLWSMPWFEHLISSPGTIIEVPKLHLGVVRTPPVVPTETPEKALLDLNFITLPGTAILIGAIISLILLKIPARKGWDIFKMTFRQLVPALLAISLMVSLGYVTRYTGMDAVLGLSMTKTGVLYPLFGTLLGWVGVALTGSDGGSNALFGSLQKMTAEQLNINPVLMGSANSAGGVMGKMISPQSIVVSSAATRTQGREAEIFKKMFRYSILFAVLVGLVVLVYAYVVPGWIPEPPQALP